MTDDEVLAVWRAAVKELGYRILVAGDGTERVYRPDGTLAIVAKPPRT